MEWVRWRHDDVRNLRSARGWAAVLPGAARRTGAPRFRRNFRPFFVAC